MSARRGLYVAGSLLCLTAAGIIWYLGGKGTPGSTSSPTADPPAKPSEGETGPVQPKIAPKDAAFIKVPDATALMKGNPNAILGKTIVAKNEGSVIYNTILKPVARTKKNEILGKPFKHTATSNGTYNLKYQDANGNYRIINSAAVLVQ